jgi:hypothetical protein
MLLLLLLFMLMGWDNVSELQPPTGLLFISQVIYQYEEWHCKDNEMGNSKNLEKTQSQWHFVHHKSHMDWPTHEPRHPWLEARN